MADRWTNLRRHLEDYRDTGSVSLTDVVTAALETLTAEDVAAWMQARPDVAAPVIRAVRVAMPWALHPTGAARPLAHDEDHFVASVYQTGTRWGWWHMGKHEPRVIDSDALDTREAAMAAADAALVAAGWALATGGAR